MRIRTLTKADQQSIKGRSTVGKELDTNLLELHLVMSSLIEPVIGEEHAEALRGKSNRAIERIAKAVLELNGMTEEAAKEAEKSFRPE